MKPLRRFDFIHNKDTANFGKFSPHCKQRITKCLLVAPPKELFGSNLLSSDLRRFQFFYFFFQIIFEPNLFLIKFLKAAPAFILFNSFFFLQVQSQRNANSIIDNCIFEFSYFFTDISIAPVRKVFARSIEYILYNIQCQYYMNFLKP